MKTKVRTFRYWLGRHLIHLGLHALPPGRVKAELWEILEDYGRHVVETVENAKKA